VSITRRCPGRRSTSAQPAHATPIIRSCDRGAGARSMAAKDRACGHVIRRIGRPRRVCGDGRFVALRAFRRAFRSRRDLPLVNRAAFEESGVEELRPGRRWSGLMRRMNRVSGRRSTHAPPRPARRTVNLPLAPGDHPKLTRWPTSGAAIFHQSAHAGGRADRLRSAALERLVQSESAGTRE